MMWVIIKRSVAARRPQNREDLAKFAEEAWNLLNQQVIIKSIDKLKAKTCEKVIEREGDWI